VELRSGGDARPSGKLRTRSPAPTEVHVLVGMCEHAGDIQLGLPLFYPFLSVEVGRSGFKQGRQ
jgi:hypothetical protein